MISEVYSSKKISFEVMSDVTIVPEETLQDSGYATFEDGTNPDASKSYWSLLRAKYTALKHRCSRSISSSSPPDSPIFAAKPLHWSLYIILSCIFGLLIGDLLVHFVPWPWRDGETSDYGRPPIILLGDSITQVNLAPS
jgi:hypothetical protein